MNGDVTKYRLCYVCPRTKFAYFTSIPLTKQWGDDWDDAPYEHNAGDPYDSHYSRRGSKEKVKHDIVTVAWTAEYRTPNDGHVNSPWSVQAINAGSVAWLIPDPWREGLTPIPAGTELADFVRIIEASGGEVYIPRCHAHAVSRTLTSSSWGPTEVSSDLSGRKPQKEMTINEEEDE